MQLILVACLLAAAATATATKDFIISKVSPLVMTQCAKEGSLLKSIDFDWSWKESAAADLSSCLSLSSDDSGRHLIAGTMKQGVYISHDVGSSWQLVNLPKAEEWISASSDALGENLAVLSRQGGLFHSNDHGLTWKKISTPQIENWTDITCDQTGQYLVLTSVNDGIFTSFDYGLNWVNSDGTNKIRDCTDVAIDVTGQYLVVVTSGRGIYHSMDHGLSWNLASLPEATASQTFKRIVSDRTGQFLVALPDHGPLLTSRDYGNSWSEAPSIPFTAGEVTHLAFDSAGNELFAVAENGAIYSSNDKGITWSTRVKTVALDQPNSALSSNAFDELFTGYKDFFPKIEKSSLVNVEQESSDQFKELYDTYQNFLSNPELSITSPPTEAPSVAPSQPSSAPTSEPSHSPTSKPSRFPSSQPSSKPSHFPSAQPTSSPTTQPTVKPSSQPSSIPTKGSYASTVSFTLTQTLNGIDATTFTSNEGIESAFQSTVQSFLSVPQLVDEVGSVVISSVVNRATASISLEATGIIDVATINTVTLTKWVAADVAFTSLQKIYAKNVTSGAVTAAFRSLAGDLVSDVSIAAPSFGAANVVTVDTPVPSSQPTSQPSRQPSAKPSSQPSSVPTSRPSRDLTKVVPTFTLTKSATTRSSATLTLTFTGETVYYSGTLFCAAYTATTITSSNYFTRLNLDGVTTSYSAGAQSVKVTLTGLIPSTSYTAYCLVENIVGRYSAFTQVTQNALTFSSDCCKALSFTTAPSFIVNDYTLYTTTTYSGKNVYSFSLDYLPSTGTTLVVQPTITGAASNIIFKFSPSSFSFTSSSTSLKASFSLVTLNTTSTTTGTVLTLATTGTAASQYNRTSVSFSTIAADQVPAPTLQSAVISNAVSSLSITFSGSTDYGGKSASTLFACSDLLTFSFFTTTGQSDSSSCLWTSASNLVAYLSTTTFVNIVVNSGGNLNKLTLLASKVKAQCNTAECRSAYTPKTTINITSPVNPPSPTVALSVPAVLAGCSNLTIDATASLGSFGRAWTSAKYVISSPNVAVDQINSVLSNVKDTTSVITLPSSSFAATSYYVTLTLTNIFGKTSSLTVPFSKSSSVNIPSASIAGATKVSILSKNSLSLTAVGSLSPCGDSDLALTYKWLVLDSQGSVLSVNSTSKVASTLILPAYSLKSGALYTALVTVRAYNSKLVNMGSANASVSVQVKSGSVIGKISGSHNRFISQDTVLDASSSYDEDVLKGSALKFKWSCISLEVLTYGDDCSSTALASLNTTAKSLTVPFSNLALGTSYSFQIVVSSSDGRSGSDAVTVKTTSVASQAISALIGISTSASTATTISRFQPINIQAFVTATVKTATPQSILAKWTGYFTDEANTFQVSNYSSLTTVSTVFNLTTTKSLSSYPFPLPIKASSFQPGTTATFRLTLSTSGTTLSYNEISYSIVTNPTGGQLSISPASGISLSDVFTVRAIDWIDDSDYLPLSYDFKYTATDGSVPTLQSQSQLNFVQSVLPAGSGSSDGGNVTVVARVFNIYGGYSSVKSNVFVSSDPNAAKNAASFLETSLANAKAAGNSDAVVSLISVTSSVLNTVNCSLVSETFCANEYNREACKSTPQTCGSCLDGYNGVYGDSNTKCTSSSRRFLAASTSCQSNSDCFYGNCNVTTKECVVPTKTCPSQCSDNGVCSYSDVNGHELSATECTVENTYCIASCSCNTGFYGQDCSLSAEDYASKEKARLVMCTNLIYAISISNPSSSLIDSLSTALNGAYDPYEVISSAGRAECLTLLEGIVALADAGYLTSSQLPSDSSSSSAVQSLLDTASNFVKIGDSSSLSDIIATLTNAVMGLLVNGEQDIQLISSNLKLSFNKIQFINVFNTQFTIPTTAEESNYGAVTPVIEFTDEDPNSVINACSEFSSGQSAQSNEANPYNYFSLAYGSWGANPFSDAENFQSVLIRTQAFTNNTVSSENSDSPLYLITYPFTSTQQLTDLSGLTKEERRLFNQTFPVCSEYFLQELNQSYLPALCTSCNVSTYDNTSVTFACYNMKSLCGSASASSTTFNAVYQSLKEFGADRRRLAESESISVSQMGATVKKSISVSTTSFNYNQFNVDLNAAIPILISIASIVIIIVIGIVYFYLWDINDYYLVKYSNRLRNRYTSMIFSNQGNPALLSEAKSTEIEDKQPGVFPQTYFDEGEDEQETLPTRVGNRLNRPSKVSFAAKKISSTQRRGSGLTRTSTEFEMNIGTSQNDILYILHNAFPAVVYDGNQAQGEAAATAEQKTLNKKSRTVSVRDVLSAAGKSFYEAMVTNNDYVSLFNSSNFYYYRLVKWMQIMMQVITILFINTLFFYIFYPDRGQCQDYRSAGDCLYHKNLITQEYLCQWSSSGNLVQQDVSCELRPPELNLPFIMLLSTVTILVAMPVVLGWNMLLINLCASVPPVWYTYLLGDSSDEVQQQRPVAARDLKSRSYDASESRRNRKVATQPPEDADEVQIRAAKSIDAYDVSRFSERVVRKPLNAIEEEEEEGKDDVVANRDFEQARMILYYINQVSANDEVDILLQSILNLCELDDRQQKKMNFATRNAKFQFIHSVLGIDSNFHTTPLSLRQQLKYTNPLSMNRSHTIEGTSYGNEDARMTISINDAQYRRIWQKLNRTHKESDEIIDFFRRQDTDEREAMRELKEEQDTEVKDILSRKREHVLLKNVQVLQFFTFEQFPMYQKYLLFYFFHHTYMYSNLHLFNSLPAELRKSHNSPLNMIAWILKALVLLGGLVYSVYFILNWSVVSQGNTFASWGLNYIIIIVEQLIMVQWIQYFYLQKIITTLLLPKLQLIYSTVYQKLVQMMLTSSPSNGRRNSAFNLYSASLESLGLSQVWPGMSYYTSSGDTHGKSLFGRGNTAMKDGSETEMRDELPLWQFLSPVARACKSNPLEKKLVIGRMVNAMSDYEMMRLKSQLSSDFSAETISNESADISRSKSSGRLFSTSYDLSGSPTSALALLRSRSNDLGASRDQFEEGREQKTRSSFQNQSNDWKQYSLFHLLFIMLPLFIIQSTFQTIFAVLPFLSSSFYTKNFILNSFHMIYLNMLFSYVAPGLISLFVIVCYYFCISVPLPAFIIVTIVVLSAVFLLTPKRNEQFWQAIGVLPASSTSPRHFTDSHQGGWLSSLMERTISLLLSPFSRSGSTPGSSYLGEQQWQRQNLPMALQPAVMSPDMSFSSDSPPYESVLMTLVASQEERDSYPSTGLGKDMMFTIPPEIHKMSPNAFAVRTREESRVTSTSSAFREYLSTLLLEDQESSRSVASTPRKFKDQIEDHPLYRRQQRLFAPDTTPPTKEGKAVGDKGKEEEQENSRSVAITSVDQLRSVVEIVINSSLTSDASSVSAAPRYYNLFHRKTDDVQLALLRAFTIRSLNVFFQQGGNDAHLVENLQMIYSASELVFDSNADDEALTKEGEYYHLSFDINEYQDILQQFFVIFLPVLATGSPLIMSQGLTEAERIEITQEFFQFLLSNDYPLSEIPFILFVKWFRAIMEKTVKYKLILQFGARADLRDDLSFSRSRSKSNSYDEVEAFEGKSLRRKRFQYQMSYERLQRVVTTDAVEKALEKSPKSFYDPDTDSGSLKSYPQVDDDVSRL